MTKAKMIEYVNNVSVRFQDARNHGNSGNWWYPKPNRIAYNVKMRAFGDVASLREVLTDVQNGYYSDEDLQARIDWQLEDEARMLADEVGDMVDGSAYYAGRSGGWLEVDYSGVEWLENDAHIDDVRAAYKEAKELEELETKVATFIEKQHKALNAYIDTPEYYEDIASALDDDETIKEHYKDEAAKLLAKAQ